MVYGLGGLTVQIRSWADREIRRDRPEVHPEGEEDVWEPEDSFFGLTTSDLRAAATAPFLWYIDGTNSAGMV